MKRRAFSTSNRRGFVLIAVMIVVSMLSYSAYEFTHWISVETETTALQVYEVQARYMAESGVALVEAMAIAKARGRDVPEPANYAELFEAISIPLSAEDSLMPAGGSTSTDVGRFTVFCSPAIQDESAPSGMMEKVVRFGTEPESARIQLNHWFATNPAALEAALLTFPGSSKELVDAILDWLDGDNEKRASGAEFTDYEEVEPSIVPRNGPIESIEELLSVRGMTPEILFGEDINRNGVLDPNEDDGEKSLPLDNQDGKLQRGWASFLTLWSQESNLDAKGQPRIYLNDPQIGMLYGRLEKEFGTEWARFIVGARIIGMPFMMQAPGPLMPGGFQFRSVLDLVDGTVTGVWEMQAVALRSPLQSTSADFGKQLAQVLDRLTVNPEPTRVGRIDIAAAPKEVLGLLTSLTQEEREKILKERPLIDLPQELNSAEASSPTATPPPTTIAWLSTGQLLPLPALRNIENSITSISPVIRFQSIGFSEMNRVSFRIEVVLDRSALPPRILSWRRLDRWGAGISLEQLGRGTEEKPLQAIGESESQLGRP